MYKPNKAPAHFTEREKELYEERTAILEFDAGYSRSKAEFLARKEIFDARIGKEPLL